MSRTEFNEAINFFLDIVSRVSSDQWAEPALGVWNIKELVGHTSRAMTTVEQYATVGADRSGVGSSDEVAQRGREAALALGEDPVSSVREIAERVVSLVNNLPTDHRVETPFGEQQLDVYLQSRVAELTIHSMDLADAINVSIDAPPKCLRESLYFLSDVAVQHGIAKDVAFALTGRKALANRFSLLPG